MKRNKSPLLSKSKSFAIKIIELSRYLNAEKREYVMSKQILRSGTSIGANLAESEGAQSLLDFISKRTISLKEAYETRFWLELLLATKLIHQPWHDQAQQQLSEIIAMLNSSILTAKSKMSAAKYTSELSSEIQCNKVDTEELYDDFFP